MVIYRISRTKFINDLSGEGAKLYGGRWNRPGVPMLYTSQARSLALLELIVHFNASSALQLDYSFLSLSVPDAYVIDIEENIFAETNINLSTEMFLKLSEEYFSKKNVMALRVPSVIIPQEFNVLLNPLHVNFSKIKIQRIEPIFLDKRLKV